MKKYLMTIAAALAFCGAFVSCSNDLDYSSSSAVQSVQDTYKSAFITAFGQPDPSNEWGFGTTTISSTRAKTQGDAREDTNSNEWADISNSTGHGGWLVPDTLTEGQKLRAQAYFQANPNLEFEDPDLENFFIQQVYKGKTDPGENSTEEVTAANRSSKYDSNNMNYMTVGESNIHINNFNSGDGSNSNVLDNYSNLGVEPKIQSYHQDKITLMVDIDDTSCFGYHMSGISKQHNDKAALVSASDIDEWAEKPANYVNGSPIGEKVVDQWNRSFLGYDLALLDYDDVKTGKYVNFYDGPGNPTFFWNGDDVISIKNILGLIKDEYTHLKDKDNKEWLQYLQNSPNKYSEKKKVKLDQENGNNGVIVRKNFWGAQVICLNMKVLQPLINKGYLPVENTSLTEWVQVSDGADGYFSDWIVTLCEAKTYNNPPDDVPSSDVVRVICEDLSVTQKSDFDFNDAVFDVQLLESNTKVKITLLAAGGTLPLTIAGQEIHKKFAEANPTLGISTGTMINTNSTNGKSCGTVSFTIDNNFGSTEVKEVAKAIPIQVYKLVNDQKEWVDIECVRGEPAAKIAVGTDYNWCDERTHIDEEYKYSYKNIKIGAFKLYVKLALGDDWYKYEGEITDEMAAKVGIATAN